MTRTQTQLPTSASAKPKNGHKATRRFMIINGDDFGFSSGVNRAIIAAHEQGVLTSTSLMVSGPAFEEAVALAKTHPDLGVGLHLTLGKGKSVLPPAQIPHLVDADGNFPNDTDRAGVYYQLNREARQEIRLEIRAQLEKFRSTGLPLSHVDGHRHMHSNPVILNTLVEFANEFGIRVIRLPSEELRLTLRLDRSNLKTKFLWSFVFTGLRLYGERVLQAKGVGFADRVYGLLQSARMTEDYLLQLIPQIQADVVEIYSHPAIPVADEPVNSPIGWGDKELNALLSPHVRQTIKECGFELTNFNHWEKIANRD